MTSILSVEQGDALDAIKSVMGQLGAVHAIAPRAYVVGVGNRCVHVAVPPTDGNGEPVVTVRKYNELRQGDWCHAAYVDLPDQPAQWLAVPMGANQ
ncbi:MAG: hypothetical protein CML03_00900 [Pseudooceanicola sp.]|nr:hypothetical protein [Pseudooceanicola sp.]|tara:strand:- start:15473 stop:15760 length:288 start_codon:yes stop_codon:yes gene_type:complete